MTIKTKLLASALVASLALGVAAPASAARWDAPGALRQEIAQLDRQVDRALDRHQISRREAAQLERQVDRLQNQWRQYARGGFSRYELSALDRQVDSVKRNLAAQVRDGDRYQDRGRGDRDGRHDNRRR